MSLGGPGGDWGNLFQKRRWHASGWRKRCHLESRYDRATRSLKQENGSVLRRIPIFLAPCLWPKQLLILLVCRTVNYLYCFQAMKLMAKQLRDISIETWACRGNGGCSVFYSWCPVACAVKPTTTMGSAPCPRQHSDATTCRWTPAGG